MLLLRPAAPGAANQSQQEIGWLFASLKSPTNSSSAAAASSRYQRQRIYELVLGARCWL
jgi:hypothetical protein